METMADDMRYLVHQSGLTNIIPLEDAGAVKMNSASSKNKGHTQEDGNKVPKYMAQLSPSQKKNLFHLYKFDFDLFNYSPDEFP